MLDLNVLHFLKNAPFTKNICNIQKWSKESWSMYLNSHEYCFLEFFIKKLINCVDKSSGNFYGCDLVSRENKMSVLCFENDWCHFYVALFFDLFQLLNHIIEYTSRIDRGCSNCVVIKHLMKDFHYFWRIIKWYESSFILFYESFLLLHLERMNVCHFSHCEIN